MKNNRKIVCYVTDNSFVPQTAISIFSLLRYNDGVLVCVFSLSLTSGNREFLSSVVLNNGGEILHFDITTLLHDLSFRYSGYGLYDGLSSFLPYVKIFVLDYLVGVNTPVLVLDSDTLILRSLDSLFNDDFAFCGKSLALASDCMPFSYRKYIKIPFDRPYFNCGVFFINSSRYRSSRFKNRFLSFLSSFNCGVFAEQDVINCFMYDDVVLLSFHYNFLTHYYIFDYTGICSFVRYYPYCRFFFDSFVDSPAIVHFSGNTLARPWFASSKHPLKSLYCWYASALGLDSSVERKGGFSPVYRLQWFLWFVLPQSLFNRVCSFLYRLHIFIRYGV